MIVYADSSVLVRGYLNDEPGHAEAVSLLTDPNHEVVTGSWSKIEVSGAIVRATRAPSRPQAIDEAGMLADWDSDTGPDGNVTVLAAARDVVEARAVELVREHGLRAMDAWHLATAVIVTPELADAGEPVGFASRDGQQAAVAEFLGFALV